jgi:UDP-N-acetylmuramoylalanine--D-glutamate ligase
MDDFKDKRVTVAGLGRFGGGISVARWLVEQGAKVLVTDKEPPDRLADSVRQLAGLPIEFHLGEHRDEDFTKCDFLVTSPAFPPTNPYLAAARTAGIPITTEIRLFVERCPSRNIIGVTGTKGKSTTTAMIGEMLREEVRSQKSEVRRGLFVGGNIGNSLLFDLPAIQPDDLVLLELSSFMLHYLGQMKWSPHVAVVTMITSDHLDWHGGREGYVEDKKNIVRFQTPDDFAVVNTLNETSRSFAQSTAGHVIYYPPDGAREFSLTVPGKHNQLNAQGAFAAASIFGVSWESAQEAIRHFKGLPHRLELVHEQNGVRYFNDSIATIPEAAVAAMDSFPPGRVIQIVGGYDKGLDCSAMKSALEARAKKVLCIGKTGKALATSMRNAELCETLTSAMKRAKEIAQPGDVILLSTGYASYDQFTNFEERGKMFASLAKGPAQTKAI